MKEFIFSIAASAMGFMLASYIQGFIFAIFKADKYEDVLVDKIVKRMKDLEG